MKAILNFDSLSDRFFSHWMPVPSILRKNTAVTLQRVHNMAVRRQLCLPSPNIEFLGAISRKFFPKISHFMALSGKDILVQLLSRIFLDLFFSSGGLSQFIGVPIFL